MSDEEDKLKKALGKLAIEDSDIIDDLGRPVDSRVPNSQYIKEKAEGVEAQRKLSKDADQASFAQQRQAQSSQAPKVLDAARKSEFSEKKAIKELSERSGVNRKPGFDFSGGVSTPDAAAQKLAEHRAKRAAANALLGKVPKPDIEMGNLVKQFVDKNKKGSLKAFGALAAPLGIAASLASGDVAAALPGGGVEGIGQGSELETENYEDMKKNAGYTNMRKRALLKLVKGEE